jgi:hypothetical protein
LIPLDDTRHNQLSGLESRETLGAAQAFSPAPDLTTITGQPGIDDLGFFVTAEWTMHTGDRQPILCFGRT